MKKSAVEILADLAVVSAGQNDMTSAVDYLSMCVKELDKKGRAPTAPESSAEFFDRFNMHPKAGC